MKKYGFVSVIIPHRPPTPYIKPIDPHLSEITPVPSAISHQNASGYPKTGNTIDLNVVSAVKIHRPIVSLWIGINPVDGHVLNDEIFTSHCIKRILKKEA